LGGIFSKLKGEAFGLGISLDIALIAGTTGIFLLS
jgi:hypothetical protein